MHLTIGADLPDAVVHGLRAESYSSFPLCILAKKKRPITNSSTVKECKLAVVDEVENNDKIRTIKNVLLSDILTII